MILFLKGNMTISWNTLFQQKFVIDLHKATKVVHDILECKKYLTEIGNLEEIIIVVLSLIRKKLTR